MCNHISEYVISQLKEYNAKKRRIAVLRYELEHPANVSFDDMIGAMSFAKGTDEGRTAGNISNKTMYIALNYRQEAERLNNAASEEIMTELIKLENEVSRLDFYIGLLEKRQAAVLRLFYFDRLQWREVSKELGVSLRTVQNTHKAAIVELCRMFELIKNSIQ